MLQSKKKRAEIGAVFVEAAIILPLFFILLFASMQLIVISWRQLQVQFLAADLVRDLAIPSPETTPRTPYDTDRNNKCVAVLATANNSAPGFNATPDAVEMAVTRAISYLTVPATTPPRTYGCGYPPGSIIILTLTYDMQLFFQKFLTFGLPNIKLSGTAVGVAQGTIT
jgi:TadE-like protein